MSHSSRLWSLLQTGVFEHWYEKALVQIKLSIRTQLRWSQGHDTSSDLESNHEMVVKHDENEFLQIQLRHLGSVFVPYVCAHLLALMIHAVSQAKSAFRDTSRENRNHETIQCSNHNQRSVAIQAQNKSPVVQPRRFSILNPRVVWHRQTSSSFNNSRVNSGGDDSHRLARRVYFSRAFSHDT